MHHHTTLRATFAGCLALLAFGVSSTANAAIIEFNPNNGQQVYEGNVTSSFENTTGIQFSVNAANANSLVLDSLGVYVGEQQASLFASRLSFNLSVRNGPGLTTIAFGYQDVPVGPADWVDFDLGGLSLPRGHAGSSARSTYVLQFSDVRIGRLNGRQYRSETSAGNPTFWSQGPLEFIYGLQTGQLSTLAPAVRFTTAAGPASVPEPSGFALLLLGGLVFSRRRAWTIALTSRSSWR